MADFKEAYSEIYRRVLGDTMAGGTPYQKFTAKLDEYFEKYGLNNDKKFEMLCSTLVSMTQGVTTSSQEIALRLLSESEELPLRKQQLEAQTNLLGKQIETEQLKIDLQKQRIPLEIEQLKLQKDMLAAQIDKTKGDLALAKAQQAAIERQVKDNRLIKGGSVIGDFLQNTLNGGLVVPADMNKVLFNIIATLLKDELTNIMPGDFNIKK